MSESLKLGFFPSLFFLPHRWDRLRNRRRSKRSAMSRYVTLLYDRFLLIALHYSLVIFLSGRRLLFSFLMALLLLSSLIWLIMVTPSLIIMIFIARVLTVFLSFVFAILLITQQLFLKHLWFSLFSSLSLFLNAPLRSLILCKNFMRCSG